ncbi:MAG: hypothetical protein O2865_06725 [Planctomycetota bacterium]|nr:hypothetical protein [Planctomycetota bacterium]
MSTARALFLPLALLAAAPCSAQQQPQSPLVASFEQFLALREASAHRLNWVSLGPVLNSARVEAVQGVPGRPGTFYAAFGSGNLWKTEDGGLSWRAIFEDQSALGIGDIALAPSDPDVIWLGSGESLKKARNFTMPGTGVFVSRDGGTSWRNVGLHDSWHIGEIAVHPNDPDTALVAVLGHFWSTNENRGLYRTTNGGLSWEHVVSVDERTGANDVVFAPSNPDVAYCSTWTNHPGVGGPGSGVHRSTDGGKTWTRLGGGLPSGDATGRIGLAVSWTNPDKVYAFVDNLNRGAEADDNPGELYRTDDGGQTWRRTHAQDLEINSRVGWYFADCYVNPEDDDEVYCLSVRIARSTDGGASFDLVGGDVTHLVPSPAQTLHLDHCEMWIDPSDPRRMLLGNDGGIHSTFDGGGSWLHHNNIPAGEFYDIAVDNGDPYLVYGGTQDDSSVRGPARERRGQGPDAWEYVWLDPWSGGDGCYTVPDPEDPNTVYHSAQHGALRRQDVAQRRSKYIAPRLPRGREGTLEFNFIAPYLVSAHDHRVLYHGGNHVMRSRDRGDSWEVASPDLTRSAVPGHGGVAAGALAESPLRQGLVVCGTDQGALWVTEDDGATWSERSQGLAPHYVRSVVASRHDQHRIYLAMTGINTDELGAFVYASDDLGRTWRSLVANLPNEPTYAIAEDPVHEDVLYLGGYRGVYVTLDRGASWSLFGQGLPAVAVADLVIQERELDLLAGTHGRGIHRLDLRPFHRFLAAKGDLGDELLPTPDAWLPRRDDVTPTPRRSDEERVPITFHLRRARDVTLQVIDASGTVLFEHALDGRAGLNQFLWDLIAERSESPKPYFTGQVRFVGPGAHEVRIRGEDLDLRGRIVIRQR